MDRMELMEPKQKMPLTDAMENHALHATKPTKAWAANIPYRLLYE